MALKRLWEKWRTGRQVTVVTRLSHSNISRLSKSIRYVLLCVCLRIPGHLTCELTHIYIIIKTGPFSIHGVATFPYGFRWLFMIHWLIVLPYLFHVLMSINFMLGTFVISTFFQHFDIHAASAVFYSSINHSIALTFFQKGLPIALYQQNENYVPHSGISRWTKLFPWSFRGHSTVQLCDFNGILGPRKRLHSTLWNQKKIGFRMRRAFFAPVYRWVSQHWH